VGAAAAPGALLDIAPAGAAVVDAVPLVARLSGRVPMDRPAEGVVPAAPVPAAKLPAGKVPADDTPPTERPGNTLGAAVDPGASAVAPAWSARAAAAISASDGSPASVDSCGGMLDALAAAPVDDPALA
jgi:hypothetical protein